MSTRKWKLRVVFWGGAITIGAIAALFAMASFESDELFRTFYQTHPVLSLIVPPVGLVIIAILTRYVFKGAEGVARQAFRPHLIHRSPASCLR